MGNCESPTIELAGRIGNKIEPQTFALVLALLVGVVLAAYLAIAEFTTAATTIVVVETSVAFHMTAYSVHSAATHYNVIDN